MEFDEQIRQYALDYLFKPESRIGIENFIKNDPESPMSEAIMSAINRLWQNPEIRKIYLLKETVDAGF